MLLGGHGARVDKQTKHSRHAQPKQFRLFLLPFRQLECSGQLNSQNVEEL